MDEQSDALACGTSEGRVPGPTAEQDGGGPRGAHIGPAGPSRGDAGPDLWGSQHSRSLSS